MHSAAVNMSSATNVMEVISRGRFELEDERGNSRHSGSSTSLPARPESQLSLECLPPEEPHFGGSFQAPPDEEEPGTDDSFSMSEQWEETTPIREEATPTSDLYSRIQVLSEQVRAELSLHEQLDTEHQGPRAVAPESSPGDENREDGSGRVESRSEFHCQDTPTEDTSTDSSSAHHYGHVSDPKLRRALEKMRKLDSKLADLSKKEKEVKRQRKLLEQQSEGGSATSQALVLMEVDGETPVESPVFATQLDENSSIAGDYSNHRPSVDEEGGGERCSGARRPGSPSQEGDQESRTRQRHQQEEQSGVNFIKRNIELAREAGTLVAMTEAEKKRLEDLLADDGLPETPFQPPPGLPTSTTGFSYNEQDLERIRDIDSRLQALMPPEDWESVCSSSRNTTPALDTEAEQVGTADSSDGKAHTSRHIGPGEEVLQRFQMTREERQRLAEIDERLLTIDTDRWSEADMVPALSQSDLDSLLEQCTGSGEGSGADITSSNDGMTAEQYHVHIGLPEQ